MKTVNKIIKFGEEVEGYSIPVLNEREIRASAGIMFLAISIALIMIIANGDFLLIKYVVTIFLTDFIIRVFVNPKFSPSLIIGRLIVSRQVPEYVGAAQKKFAWKIGIALSALMFILLVIVNSYSVITVITCFMCLTFLFFETAFGICLGCLFYSLFYKKETQLCAGETCDATNKKDIQKISWVQVFTLFGFFVFILLTILYLNDRLRIAPANLKTIINSL